jgi:hypothetical protein
MKVSELIELLKTYPQDLDVIYDLFSEHCLLNAEDISVIDACEPRKDGWVPRARPDKVTKKYLSLPGN